MGKKKRDRQELLPGTLDMLILKALSRSVMHGYGIAEHIRQMSEEVLHVEEGSLYPALQRMLRAGWVKARWDTSSSGRRVRVYAITPGGRTRLEREVSNFERMLEGIRLVLAPVKP
jgi:PadR family transcriptional regulator, regulatory protein PadR